MDHTLLQNYSLAQHFGFTDEELDFIPSTQLRAGINYDIKYRMGREEESAEEALNGWRCLETLFFWAAIGPQNEDVIVIHSFRG